MLSYSLSRSLVKCNDRYTAARSRQIVGSRR